MLRMIPASLRRDRLRRDPLRGVGLRRALAAAALLLASPLVGCTTNPATGQSYFNALSREEEIAIGQQATPELIEQYGGEVDSPAAKQYLSTIGQRLADQTEGEYPSLPWEFYLLDSDVINAFALPGGKVFISRGLVEKMNNEAQLAGVIGHEIAHVTAQHVDQRVTQQLSAQIGLSALSIFLGTDYQLAQQAAGLVANGVVLKYGREQELESDRLGMRYMNRAGYSPWGQRQVMEILAQAGGGGGGPEFFSAHPFPETRIEQIDRLLSEKYPQASPQENTFPQRFRNQMLSRLSALPRPAHGGDRIAIGGAHAWCGVCIASAAE